MKFTLKHAALALSLAGVFSAANATPLVAQVPSTSVDVVASFFGGTLLDSAITGISNISYNGAARTAVYDTGSGLDFYYQFTNNPSAVNGVDRLSAFNFSSLGTSLVDVFQTSAGFGIFTDGTEPADYADRTTAGVIGFNFVPNGQSKIEPGTTSFIQVIRTNARAYTAGNFGLLDGIGDNAVGFAPTAAAAVPEPETYAMLLAGLGLMGVIARRRSAPRS